MLTYIIEISITDKNILFRPKDKLGFHLFLGWLKKRFSEEDVRYINKLKFCALTKSPTFFLLCMSLNNPLVSNVKTKHHQSGTLQGVVVAHR